MESQSSDIQESLLSVLECPVCMEYMRPPITFCVNGHNICNICKQKVALCPSCRGQLLNTRNLALQDLARKVNYPCKFRANGCTETRDLNTIGGHEVLCQYRQQECPAAKLKVRTCSWTGSFKDMKGHLRENHIEICKVYMKGDIKILYNLPAKVGLFFFIFAYGEIFFSAFQEEKETFYAAVLYVGPAENAAKYKYRVEFVNKDNSEGVTVMHLTRSYNENLRDVYSSGNCGRLHSDVLRRLVNEEGKVKFNLEIIRVAN